MGRTKIEQACVEPPRVYQLMVTLMGTWIEGMTGGPFDPDAFDLDAVNRALKALRAK